MWYLWGTNIILVDLGNGYVFGTADRIHTQGYLSNSDESNSPIIVWDQLNIYESMYTHTFLHFS